MNQPLRDPLGAGDGADLITLALAPQRELTRRTIESYVDRQGAVPLLSCWKGGRGEIFPDVLGSVVRRVQHRWPSVVINPPFTCRPDTIATAIGLSTHVLLIADEHHRGHGWLYQRGHQLSELADQQRVTVATVGANDSGAITDTVCLPAVGRGRDAHAPLTVPTTPQAITMYERILGRVYRS